MSAVDNAELQERLRTTRLVAILRGTDVDATVAAARTLLQVGVLTLEIALTLQDAEEAIAQIVQDAPATALVGAGTVLDEADVERAVSAGAQFMVTPTLSASVPYAVSQGIGVLAGVYTPTEIQRGHDLGSAAVKLFPASALGSGFLRAVRDPFPQARIIPVGACVSTRSPSISRRVLSASGWAGRSSETPRLPAATSRRSRFAPARSSRHALWMIRAFHRFLITCPSISHMRDS